MNADLLHCPHPMVGSPRPTPSCLDSLSASSSLSCASPCGPLSHCRALAGPHICFVSKVPDCSVRDYFASIVPLRTTHRGSSGTLHSKEACGNLGEKQEKGND